MVAVCYAVGPVILQRWLADAPPLGVIAASLGVSALVYVPVTALAGPGQAPSPDALASIVVLAVVCTAIAFLVFFALITEIGPVRATVITYVNPAVAAALGVVVLGEDFTLGMGLGFVLVTRRLGARHPSRPFTGRAAPHRPGACPDRLLTTVCQPPRPASGRITPRTSARDGSRRTPSCPPQAPSTARPGAVGLGPTQEVGLDLPDEPAAELDANSSPRRRRAVQASAAQTRGDVVRDDACGGLGEDRAFATGRPATSPTAYTSGNRVIRLVRSTGTSVDRKAGRLDHIERWWTGIPTKRS